MGKFLEGEGGVAAAALSGVYNPVQLGLYTYTNHNPLKLKDPNGRESVGEWLEQQGAAAAAAGDDARLNQLGVVYALWTAFGSEGLSQIADEYASGERAPDGSGVSAAIEIATGPIQFGKLLRAAVTVGGFSAMKLAKSGVAWVARRMAARKFAGMSAEAVVTTHSRVAAGRAGRNGIRHADGGYDEAHAMFDAIRGGAIEEKAGGVLVAPLRDGGRAVLRPGGTRTGRGGLGRAQPRLEFHGATEGFAEGVRKIIFGEVK